jgi:Domain of unknown function (DUF4190)
MKVCPACGQAYTDENINFCLNDGSTLNRQADDAPPATVLMNNARATDPQFKPPPSAWQEPSAPVSPWQGGAPMQNQPYPASSIMYGSNQTLPVISLVLGILSIFVCCYGGIPFGIPALITGYLGMNNANSNPSQYSGKNLAVAGMITGGIGLLIPLLLLLIGLLGGHK